MGQKTHPTGLRIGINKTHSSTWFANYGAYSEVLKEDYKIRTFFEKEFAAIYSKAGITKLEILRKVNQLELLVHAARPKAIAADTDQNNLINVLKDKLANATHPCDEFQVCSYSSSVKSRSEASEIAGRDLHTYSSLDETAATHSIIQLLRGYSHAYHHYHFVEKIMRKVVPQGKLTCSDLT